MAKRAKSAADLVEQMAGLAEEVRTSAVAETRAYVGRQLEDDLLKTTGRAAFGGTTPDQSILDALGGYDSLLAEPVLQAARARFEADGPSEDFRAGLLMAIRLLADPDYDY